MIARHPDLLSVKRSPVAGWRSNIGMPPFAAAKASW
jgi:hypothetical protein